MALVEQQAAHGDGADGVAKDGGARPAPGPGTGADARPVPGPGFAAGARPATRPGTGAGARPAPGPGTAAGAHLRPGLGTAAAYHDPVLPGQSPPTAAGGPEPPGSEFLQLRAGDVPAAGKAEWLAALLRRAIGDGRLGLGSKLPPTRLLAAELRVSRGVITEAYRLLTEDGHLSGRRRGGTVVVAAPAPPRTPPPRRADPDPEPDGLFTGAPGYEIFDALRTASAPVDLTPGRPDLTAFPRAAWLRAEREVLAGLSAEQLGYGDPRSRAVPRSRAARRGCAARSPSGWLGTGDSASSRTRC